MKLQIAWFKSSLHQSRWMNVAVRHLHDVESLSEAGSFCSCLM